MRKYSMLFVAGFVLFLFSAMLSSCNKHHEDPIKPKLSFTEATRTVKESDGDIEVTMTLDQPAPEAVSIIYELGTGSATDKVSAGNGAYDYEITSSYLETKIKKGETSGTITITLYSDFGLEDDETIDLEIKSTDSDNIEITRDDNMKITILQEDGLLVGLSWPAPTTDSLADMDLLLRVGASTSAWDGVLTGSAEPSFEGPEFIFIPKVIDYAAYGLSYTYYDGTYRKLKFTSSFIDFTNGDFEPAASQQTFDATYSAANKNKWDDVNTTVVVQTFGKTGGAFTAPTVITVPLTSSRTASSGHLIPKLKKGDATPSTRKSLRNLQLQR